jgi:hypothetical protein
MSKFSMLFCTAAIAIFATAAFADDPALFQDGTNCATTYWCASASVGNDPVTGDDTLEFKINTSTGTTQGITLWTGNQLGWVAATNPAGTVVQDLIDFEVIGGQDVAFLYCGDTKCSSDDLGLPKGIGLPTNTFVDGTQYSPTLSQPGGGSSYAYNNENVLLKDSPGYQIIDTGSLNGKGVSAPEPSAWLLLASMVFAVAALGRRKLSARD